MEKIVIDGNEIYCTTKTRYEALSIDQERYIMECEACPAWAPEKTEEEGE